MTKPDIDQFTNIVKRAGMELPDLSYLASHIKKFLEDIDKIFGISAIYGRLSNWQRRNLFDIVLNKQFEL